MAKVQGHAPNGSRDQQSMVHVQLLGEDGYKDTLDHSTESTPFIPSFCNFPPHAQEDHQTCFLASIFFLRKRPWSIGCQFGGDCLKSSKIQTGYKRPADFYSSNWTKLRHMIASSMDSAYTNHAVLTPLLINSAAQLNRACAERFRKVQKALRTPTPLRPRRPQAAGEDSTGGRQSRQGSPYRR